MTSVVEPEMGEAGTSPQSELSEALRLFDETTRALDARSRRLEEVLTAKQRELQRTNQRLEEQFSKVDRLSAYLNLLLSSVASGVIAVDAEGVIITCNPAAEQALEGLRCNLIGADYRQLFPHSPLERVLAGERRPQRYEHRVPDVDGRERHLAGRLSAIRDGEDQLIGAVEVFEDVTDLQRLREQAERGERLRALGEMAAGVAHEIRNPLNGIEGFASLLLRDIGSEGGHARYVEQIITGVRHLNATVTGLLEFTRPRMPQRRAVPVSAVLEECCHLVEAEYAEDTAAAQLLAYEDAWGEERRLSCDPQQIRQVLLNLIQNACQAAIEAQGLAAARVRISIAEGDQEHSGHCLIRVDDNGPGVPQDARQTIFTPFFTTKDRGTGLGLAVAHTLVGLHDGQLAVADAPLGGARFSLALPLCAPVCAPAEGGEPVA